MSTTDIWCLGFDLATVERSWDLGENNNNFAPGCLRPTGWCSGGGGAHEMLWTAASAAAESDCGSKALAWAMQQQAEQDTDSFSATPYCKGKIGIIDICSSLLAIHF